MNLKPGEILMMIHPSEYHLDPPEKSLTIQTVWATGDDFLTHHSAGEAFGRAWHNHFHSHAKHQSNIRHASHVFAAVSTMGLINPSKPHHLDQFDVSDFLGFALLKCDPHLQIRTENHLHHPVWSVEEMMTVKTKEGQGIGSAVMHCLLRNAHPTEPLFLAADTALFKDATNLVAFYSRFGFKEALDAVIGPHH